MTFKSVPHSQFSQLNGDLLSTQFLLTPLIHHSDDQSICITSGVNDIENQSSILVLKENNENIEVKWFLYKITFWEDIFFWHPKTCQII